MEISLRRSCEIDLVAAALRCLVILAAMVANCSFDEAAAQFHKQDRPYFMPASERSRIQRLILTEEKALDQFVKIRALARSDGYWAAWMYALEGDESYLSTAKKWLMKYGTSGGDLGERALSAKADFFRHGQPWLGDVYYNIDHRPLVAYDWIYSGLRPHERDVIESGIVASALFRMRAMDRWSQTPNLVFKPTFMVALAGLVTDNRRLIEWGLHRNPGSTRGGYFSVLDTMLLDEGPWAEAPPYAISHKPLLLMLRMSRLLQLYSGTDWFRRKSLNGGSPRGLLQYYINSAYPIERTGLGKGRIRIATYGDGATNPNGDLFLVNPTGAGIHMHEELAEAFGLSAEPQYAGFLAFVPDYAPSLLDRTVTPRYAELPPAPSRVWPNLGVAMLRSEESSKYWTSERSIAVLQRMTQGYSHSHRDAFAITLHGRGRLLYPDYNFIQYENPKLGWTRNTIAHNTVVVDGEDSADKTPTNVRHSFSSDVKFLATSASGVFSSVDQTRALMLTSQYLIDFFHVSSKVPRTYDYLLHSFGRPQPKQPKTFSSNIGLGTRYNAVQKQLTTVTNKSWKFDFILDEKAVRAKEKLDAEGASLRDQEIVATQFGNEWYKHVAAVRITMAADPRTQITYGIGPDNLSLLAARRSETTDTIFTAVHEPFTDSDRPLVSQVSRLGRTKDATVVRVDAKNFTDYAAVALGPQRERSIHVIENDRDQKSSFAFKDYGYLRVHSDGRVIARGEWISFRIPAAHGPVTINGNRVEAQQKNGYLVYGDPPQDPDPIFEEAPRAPFEVEPSSKLVRMLERDDRPITFRFINPLDRSVSGNLEFDLPEGLTTDPLTPRFRVAANGTQEIVVRLHAEKPALGRHIVPYRASYRTGIFARRRLARPQSVEVTVGPVLKRDYSSKSPAYRIDGRHYVAAADMFAGLFVYLADDDGQIRIDGSPLFTFSDGKTPLLSENTEHAFTWPVETPAQLTAHAYDKCRWQAVFFPDRIMVRMDRDWTQFERTYFTVPGQWISPLGPPNWAAVVTEDGSLARAPSRGAALTIRAAELNFPGSDWNLCFDFSPAQEVTFKGAGLQFSIRSLTDDQWTVGFCRTGSVDSWRWK